MSWLPLPKRVEVGVLYARFLLFQAVSTTGLSAGLNIAESSCNRKTWLYVRIPFIDGHYSLILQFIIAGPDCYGLRLSDCWAQ